MTIPWDPSADETVQAAGLPSAAFDHGRFAPGAVLAGRYRIIGLLGRGAMLRRVLRYELAAILVLAVLTTALDPSTAWQSPGAPGFIGSLSWITVACIAVPALVGLYHSLAGQPILSFTED